MTAFPIALVLCVAMVCATRIHLKYVERRRDTAIAHDVHKALFTAESTRDVLVFTCKVVDELRKDVDQLKANAAFRSLG